MRPAQLASPPMSADPLQSLFVFGCSHHSTPIEVRERFTLAPEQADALRHNLIQTPGLHECLVLGTCNRTEIYGLARSPQLLPDLEQAFCSELGIDPDDFQQYAYRHHNLDTLQHLCEVSAGLDSQMVGEPEILGQVKDAYASAKAAQSVGPVLSRLFEKSFQAAKAARTQTGINRGHVGIGNIAADLSNRIFGQLHHCRALLLGSGEVGTATAQALASRGVADISVSSRTLENARKLAHKLGGAAIDFSIFSAQLHRFDIVVSSTAAPGHILTAETIRQALRQRPGKPVFLLDLAMPRDIDPAVHQLDNLYLYNLDDLSAMANENLAQRKAEIEKARRILKAQAWTLWLQLRRRTRANAHG
ncbi:MAG: glutamyl-tRNA reductase [Coraliomargarita sp.]